MFQILIGPKCTVCNITLFLTGVDVRTPVFEYQIKDAICHLESLEQLDLGENEIDSLPLNFGALTKLRELWLDTNDIKVLPQSIGGLKDLSIADFANNKIEVIPDTIEGCIRIGFFL